MKNWCRWPRASNFALSTKCIVWYPILFKYRNLQDYKIESGTKLDAGCKCTCTYYISVQSISKYLHEQTRSISALYAILNTNLFTNIDLPSAFDFIFMFHYETKSLRQDHIFDTSFRFIKKKMYAIFWILTNTIWWFWNSRMCILMFDTEIDSPESSIIFTHNRFRNWKVYIIISVLVTHALMLNVLLLVKNVEDIANFKTVFRIILM